MTQTRGKVVPSRRLLDRLQKKATSNGLLEDHAMASGFDFDTPPEPSASTDDGVKAPSREERQLIWRQGNDGAIADYNLMIATSGLPLAQFRKF